jgi:hypothetical protein
MATATGLPCPNGHVQELASAQGSARAEGERERGGQTRRREGVFWRIQGMVHARSGV